MKKLITNYTFSKSAKTITFNDFSSGFPIALKRILGIYNITRGVEMFNILNPSLIGTVSNNVLTLTLDTTGSGFADADELMIFYDVPEKSARDTLTATLASLANNAARQSTLKTKPEIFDYVDLYLKITSGGSAPNAGSVYEVHLLTSDGTVFEDNAGASDAAITLENSTPIGAIVLTANTAKAFYIVIRDVPLHSATSWGIAIKNVSGNALSSTEGDHVKGFVYHN